VPCHMFKTQVDNHEGIKQEILNSIDSLGVHSVINNGEKISNSDWQFKMEAEEFASKKYIEIVLPKITIHNCKLQEQLGFIKQPEIQNIWFQQYVSGDFHDWHVHGRCMFSNVYYVELPKLSSKTMFRHFNQEFTVDIEEGEILTFPSFFQHCSKPNNYLGKKTVISFNTNFYE